MNVGTTEGTVDMTLAALSLVPLNPCLKYVVLTPDHSYGEGH